MRRPLQRFLQQFRPEMTVVWEKKVKIEDANTGGQIEEIFRMFK